MSEIQVEKSQIPKLTLGTVQLGMDYGIANTKGRPQKEASWQLLQYALEAGTTILDTARHYQSEEVIGESGLAAQFTIVSKFKLSQFQLQSMDVAMAEARRSVTESCGALQVKKLPVCLFHQDIDNPISRVAEVVPGIFRQLKEEGLIDKGGISVYYPHELQAIKDWDVIEAVQVPMNVFDLRLLKNGLLQQLKQNGTTVFVRSVFLQGLLFVEPEHLPAHLVGIKPYLLRLKELADRARMSIAQLAFAYIRDTEGVSSLVIGVESIAQIKENINFLNGPELTDEIRVEIESSFNDIPEVLITPGLWHTIK